jgi:alanine dehydrogenase
MKENPEIKKGANVIQGRITFQGVADAFGLKLADIEKLL